MRWSDTASISLKPQFLPLPGLSCYCSYNLLQEKKLVDFSATGRNVHHHFTHDLGLELGEKVSFVRTVLTISQTQYSLFYRDPDPLDSVSITVHQEIPVSFSNYLVLLRRIMLLERTRVQILSKHKQIYGGRKTQKILLSHHVRKKTEFKKSLDHVEVSFNN